MPVLLARREPDHITRPDLLERSAFSLNPSAARRNDQDLTERMRVPSSSRTRLKCNAGALNKRRIGCLKKGIDANGTSEPLLWAFRRWLGANSFDFHFAELLELNLLRYWLNHFNK